MVTNIEVSNVAITTAVETAIKDPAAVTDHIGLVKKTNNVALKGVLLLPTCV